MCKAAVIAIRDRDKLYTWHLEGEPRIGLALDAGTISASWIWSFGERGVVAWAKSGRS